MRQVKIGLALGSGPTQGRGHTGGINGLERADIQIVVIFSCCVVTLVGTRCTSGSLSLLDWVSSLSYWDMFRLVDISWRRDGALRSSRVFNPNRLRLRDESAEQCYSRFCVLIANPNTGHDPWLTKGNLFGARCASCSMPGLVPLHNLCRLVNSAVVNLVPLLLARVLWAGVVIVVNLQQDAHFIQQKLRFVSPAQSEVDMTLWYIRLCQHLSQRRTLLSSDTEIMTTSIRGLENRLKRNRMAGDPPDVLLQPHCPQISTFDFHRAEEAIAAGPVAVEKKWMKYYR